MAFNLKNRNFLKLLDFTPQEIRFLLDLSRDLKRAKYAGTEQPRLRGKSIALIFEKSSTRTRCAFESAAFDQGANVTCLGPSGSHIGAKETMKDTARVLGRMYDGIQYRGYAQETVEILGRYAGVPVWNGLTDEFHPTQVLADLMTIEEHLDKPLCRASLCYVGDGANNMGNSLLVGSARMGLDFRLAAPEGCQPEIGLVEQCREIAGATGARLTITEDIDEGVRGVDFLYTDVWVSMGQPDSLWDERIRLLTPYQVNSSMLERTGNPAVRFLHCLPAFHNKDTSVGKEIYDKYGLDGMEVTEDVFESHHSIVFDQAENRVHTIKAVMVATIGG
ncbi:MAG: ornithine carbamoyltransferase [Armatimonadetes bacterium]|nr:ornithine carbamoyltransferase [Armatimonadota bacterium]